MKFILTFFCLFAVARWTIGRDMILQFSFIFQRMGWIMFGRYSLIMSHLIEAVAVRGGGQGSEPKVLHIKKAKRVIQNEKQCKIWYRNIIFDPFKV